MKTLLLTSAIICAIFSLCLQTSQGQFAPFDFHTTYGNSGTVVPNAGGDDVDSVLAANAIAGYEAQNAFIGEWAIISINSKVFGPISNDLMDLSLAKQNGNPDIAKAAADDAMSQYQAFQKANGAGGVLAALAQAGPAAGPTVANFANYVNDLQKAVNDGQSTAQSVADAKKTDIVGINMLSAAAAYSGQPYAKGMQCSDLIAKAAKDAGVPLTTTPVAGGTVTTAWFKNGMGPSFQQIYGGGNGILLQQLVDDEGSMKISIPLGSVIVADGHAALFRGMAYLGGSPQIILFDANSQSGWTVSVGGVPCQISEDQVNRCMKGNPMLQFPGNQVGEHVTRLQWATDHLVKVFQPIIAK